MKGKFNQQLSKNQTNIYLSNLETCNSSTLWVLSVVQLVLIPSWRLTRPAKRKGVSRMNGLIGPKNSRIRHFQRKTSFSANYVIATLWIKPTLNIKVSSTLDAAVKKLWKNYDFLQFLPQDKRIMHIYSKYGKTTTCNHSKLFFDGTKTSMLCQRLEWWQKWLSFIIVSELICWSCVVRYQISQTFIFIALQMSSFTRSRKETKTSLKK